MTGTPVLGAKDDAEHNNDQDQEGAIVLRAAAGLVGILELGQRDSYLRRRTNDRITAVLMVNDGCYAEKAKVFKNGRSQAVRIPAAYRFKSNEVSIRRDQKSGDVILSEKPSWEDIFAALDAAGFPEDFLADRQQGAPQVREEL